MGVLAVLEHQRRTCLSDGAEDHNRLCSHLFVTACPADL